MKHLILIILIFILFILLKKSYNENFSNLNINNNYICFLCVKLSDELIETAQHMLQYGYKVFIMVDDNSVIHPKVIKDINILQLDDKKCVNLGYKNASATLKKNPVTWDKVFYHFSNIDTNFNNIWFIEEDVFIPRFDLIKDLDNQNPTQDLLCKQDIAEVSDELNWHWNRAQGKIEKPWYRSLLCCHRQSRRLLQRIKDYSTERGSLLFLEMMVNTLAHHNNYSVKTLPNLQTITWRDKFKFSDISKNNLYHPMKNLKEQNEFRKRL